MEVKYGKIMGTGKSISQKRANELKDLMIKDIERCDKESFIKHMATARNYMTKKEISPLYIAFITHHNN